MIEKSHNSIFICVCCQLRGFKSNVVLFSEKLKEIITSKNSEILDICIGQKREIAKFHTENIHQKWKNKYEDDIENNNSEYICNNCVKYLKRNKMPPMCFKNNLDFYETEADLKKKQCLK